MLDNPKTDLKASIQVASEVNQDSTAWGHSVVTPHPDVQCSVLDGEAITCFREWPLIICVIE